MPPGSPDTTPVCAECLDAWRDRLGITTTTVTTVEHVP